MVQGNLIRIFVNPIFANGHLSVSARFLTRAHPHLNTDYTEKTDYHIPYIPCFPCSTIKTTEILSIFTDHLKDVKHLYLFGLLLSLPFFCFSQGEFNNWLFGCRTGITFNTVPPSPLPTNHLCAARTSVSVSDSLGNLLFYSDGCNVLNRNHNVMPNGDNITSDCDCDMRVGVLQSISDDSIYYLFWVNLSSQPPTQSPDNGLYYSVVDMRLDGGLGDIPAGQKKIMVQPNSTFPEEMVITRHQNNRDAWVVVKNYYNQNNYCAYLVTAAGVSTTPVVSPSVNINTYPSCNNGTMRISPDGTKLVYPRLYGDSNEFCSFNRATGRVTHMFWFGFGQLPFLLIGGGSMEFSLDSRYLYLGTGDLGGFTGDLFQFDASLTDSTAFQMSMVHLGNYNHRLKLQRGPDGKIYVGEAGIDSLMVINYPEIGGWGCSPQYNAIGMSTGTCSLGMPVFCQRYFIYICDTGACVGLPVHFYPWTFPPPDSVHWNFGDPSSGVANNSSLPNPSHTYANTGTYTVELFVRHNDKRTDTTWKTITIIAGPTVTLGADRTICTGDSTTFDAGVCPGCTYQWKDLGSGSTVGNSQTFETGVAGNYVVLVTNSSGCTGMDTIQLLTTAAPSVTNNPLSDTICTGDSTNIQLTSSLPGTNFYWTASLTSGNISGFSTDSGMVINQVLTNSLSTPGIVTYHITPKIDDCSGTTVDYQVTVNPGDSVKVSISSSANNICAGTSVTYTAAPTNPGTTPSYQWKVNGADAGTNSTSFIYTPANGDVVTCVLSASVSGCSPNNPALSNQVVMVVNSILAAGVSVAASSNPFCAGASVTFTATPVNGGILPTFEWLVDGIVVQQGGSDLFTTASLSAGQIVACRLTSAWPCLVANPVTSPPLSISVAPDPVVSLTDKPALCVGEVSRLDAGPDYASYRWQDGSTGRYLDVSGEGVYYVTVTDTLGCKGSDTARIQVCDAVIYMPNAFTPDGDGLNDVFKPVTTLEGISAYTLLIYDRWGTEVFESSNILNGWDGMLKGKPAPVATYVWKIIYQTTSQGTISPDIKSQGTVELVR